MIIVFTLIPPVRSYAGSIENVKSLSPPWFYHCFNAEPPEQIPSPTPDFFQLLTSNFQLTTDDHPDNFHRLLIRSDFP